MVVSCEPARGVIQGDKDVTISLLTAQDLEAGSSAVQVGKVGGETKEAGSCASDGKVLGEREMAWLCHYRSERDGIRRRRQQFC